MPDNYLNHLSLTDIEEDTQCSFEVRRPMAWSSKDEQNPEEEVIIRRLDWNIMPVVTALFMLSILDRINLGNAAIAGLTGSLHLRGAEFSTAVAVFYVTYVTTELFANIMLRFSKLNVLLGGTMFAWGSLSLITGLIVTSYKDLIIMRLLLGVAEGFLIPALMFYITLWYPQSYWSMRLAIFWAAPTFAGSFGGLIARGCAQIHDPHRPSWTYIFIIEGGVTMFIGFVALLVLPDSIRSTRFLNCTQRQFWARRLEQDRGYRFESRPMHHVKRAFLDWKVWLFGVSAFSLVASVTAVGVFLPTVIKNLGYTSNAAQIMTVPVFGTSCASIIFFGWLARRMRMYGPPLIICLVIGATAAICLQIHKSARAQYGLTFLLGVGMFPGTPLIIGWAAANLHPATKRGVGIGIVIAMASCGGVLASFTFIPNDAKSLYQTGHFALMWCILGSLLISIFFVVFFRMHAFSRGPLEHDLQRYAMLTLGERFEEDLKGDKAMNFRYQI